MRIPISCDQCVWDEIRAEEVADLAAVERGEEPPVRLSGRPFNPANWYLADIEDDNAYVGTCRNGHQTRKSLQNVRFELLYESGVVAMLVGFQREAVSSFAAALERFYECAIEAFTLRAGIEQDAHVASWKLVKKQSERQLGAFLFLYLCAFKKPFLTGSARASYDDQVTFRNRVIHEGHFPSYRDTQAYAQRVFELIRDTRQALRELDFEAVQKVELIHLVRGHAAVDAKAGEPQPGPDGFRDAIGGIERDAVVVGLSERASSRSARLTSYHVAARSSLARSAALGRNSLSPPPLRPIPRRRSRPAWRLVPCPR